jgi:hypothetical protein
MKMMNGMMKMNSDLDIHECNVQQNQMDIDSRVYPEITGSSR